MERIAFRLGARFNLHPLATTVTVIVKQICLIESNFWP